AVPLTLVDPAAGDLLERAVEARVVEPALRQAVRLNLLAPLVVADQLVVLVDLVGGLARGVPQLGVEEGAGDRADEVRLADRRLLVAVREVPPHFVLLD